MKIQRSTTYWVSCPFISCRFWGLNLVHCCNMLMYLTSPIINSHIFLDVSTYFDIIMEIFYITEHIYYISFKNLSPNNIYYVNINLKDHLDINKMYFSLFIILFLTKDYKPQDKAYLFCSSLRDMPSLNLDCELGTAT